MNTLPKPLLTVDDLAALLQVTPVAVRRMRDRGTLPDAIKFGRHVRWDPDDITTWLTNNKGN